MSNETTISILTEAISEADRFIRKAELARERLINDKFAGITGSKETAAAKRASMDLTRALVRVRKSRI